MSFKTLLKILGFAQNHFEKLNVLQKLVKPRVLLKPPVKAFGLMKIEKKTLENPRDIAKLVRSLEL